MNIFADDNVVFLTKIMIIWIVFGKYVQLY